MEHNVCDSCRVVLLNNDASGVDADTMMSIMSFEELVGMLAFSHEKDGPGYWECDACNEVCIGSSTVLVNV